MEKVNIRFHARELKTGWNRQQRVFLKGEASDWLFVTSGAPQGSVLGSTLLIIYIHDLECYILSKVAKFADDTIKHRWRCNKRWDWEKKIQSDLINLAEWSDKLQMSFKVEKCKVMHSSKHSKISIPKSRTSPQQSKTRKRSQRHHQQYSQTQQSKLSSE